MKLSALAEKLSCRLEGDPFDEITGIAGMDHAVPGQVTFLANRRYFPLLRSTRATAIFVEEGIRIERDPGLSPLAALRSNNPYLAFARAIELFYQPPAYPPGIHPTAVIAKAARVGANAHIGPYCFVDENVSIGAHAVLHSFVSIYQGAKIGDHFFAHAHSVVREHCQIGNRVILQNGVIIGADGLGFAKLKDGSWYKMSQSGPAVLEDDVEIQANACIDRASVGETRIARGVKIDNLTQVGHGSMVGEHTLLCAQAGLAGSTVIGKNVIVAGQAGIAGHCNVGDGVIITAQSGTHGDIPAGTMVSGSPAFDHKQWLRAVNAFVKLPEMARTLKKLAAAKSTEEK